MWMEKQGKILTKNCGCESGWDIRWVGLVPWRYRKISWGLLILNSFCDKSDVTLTHTSFSDRGKGSAFLAGGTDGGCALNTNHISSVCLLRVWVRLVLALCVISSSLFTSKAVNFRILESVMCSYRWTQRAKHTEARGFAKNEHKQEFNES